MENLPCCLIKSNGLKSSSQKHWQKLIYIYPKTMHQLGYHYRQPLVINNNLLFYAWPHKSMNANCVGFLKEHFDAIKNMSSLEKDQKTFHCDVLPLNVPDVPEISTCYFTFTTNNFKQVKLINYSFLEKTYLQNNESLSINYLGAEVTLTIHIESISFYPNLTTEAISTDAVHKNKFFKFTSKSKVFSENYVRQLNDDKSVKLNDLGGLNKIISTLNCLVKVHLLENVQTLKKIFPKRCLLSGPSGCGKSSVVYAVAKHHNLPIISINTSSFDYMYEEDRARKLQEIENQLNAPTIVFVDSLETLSASKKSISANLDSFLNDLVLKHKLLVLGATNKIDLMDPYLLSSRGIFSFVCHVYPPSAQERHEIILKQMKRLQIDVNCEPSRIKELADSCHGYSGADLHSACVQVKHHMTLNGGMIDDGLMMRIFHQIVPSVMKEIAIKSPQVKWEDIGGRDDLKKILDQCIHMPIKHPEVFERLKVKPPRGILMFGPPGCSKTMLVKALATESKLNFISVQGTSLRGMFVGETERAIRNLFMRARSAAPSIVFFDEIEAFAMQRGSTKLSAGSVDDRAVQQLLVEIDGITDLKDVFIVAATNRPDLIDPAFMRPGRFDRCIYVPLPDDDTRRKLIITKLNRTFENVEEAKRPFIDVETIVQLTQRYSCAELSNVIDEAFLLAMRDDIQEPSLNMQHIEKVLASTNPMTCKETVAWYEDISSKFLH
ncbi:hypothetical protein HELRODRAFT_107062 [Helobdella robusta]|uniref:AAA+ ATPase domain-containing protein n=1 Tax=Helobdella robusta TaxID=6412 RepID=T1EE70_HELRO|nr:hypothetical protein HELRODRAFT_107062 [Helobdella robusta]ESN98908.1 hypothetical protein HELRODRAFT_107062 [Helobdella robusta]